MENYFESSEYEIRKKHLTDLLFDFHHAVKAPVWLYTQTASMLIAVPENAAPVSIRAELFSAVTDADKPYVCSQNCRICMITQITTQQGQFGYLCTELSDDTDPDTVSGVRRILELVKNEIVRDNLIILQYQRYVDQFKAMIWNLTDKDLSVGALCELLGVGKTKLSSDFQKYAGTSIAKFILNVRLEKAQVLLTTTELSVTDIAGQVGFSDYNYFCRVFRKYIGMSPQSYRTRNVL